MPIYKVKLCKIDDIELEINAANHEDAAQEALQRFYADIEPEVVVTGVVMSNPIEGEVVRQFNV